MIVGSDLAEVLISGLYGTQDIIAARYGQEVGERFWQRHLDLEPEFTDLMRGKMSEHYYWHEFLKGDDWPFGVKEAMQAFSENMRRTIPGTVQVYQRIISYPRSFSRPDDRVQGMPEIDIISDHILERLPELQRNHPGIFAITRRRIWSCVVGMIKEDDSFFGEALDRLRIGPDELVFIDDRPANIASAERYGIQSILFQDAAQLERELTALGFEFAPLLAPAI